MEEGTGIATYILVAVIIFGLFVAMVTGIFGDNIKAQMVGMIEQVEEFMGKEGGPSDELPGEEDEGETEPEPEQGSGGYKGSKHKLDLTDEEIDAMLSSLGFEFSIPLGRRMLKNDLTYDELENLIAGGGGDPWEQQGAIHLKNWLNNQPLWYPQVAGETIQSLEPITKYTSEIANVLKNERNQTAAQQEMNAFHEYSMKYPAGSYERMYYDKTIQYLGHNHGVQVDGSGVILGNWGT